MAAQNNPIEVYCGLDPNSGMVGVSLVTLVGRHRMSVAYYEWMTAGALEAMRKYGCGLGRSSGQEFIEAIVGTEFEQVYFESLIATDLHIYLDKDYVTASSLAIIAEKRGDVYAAYCREMFQCRVAGLKSWHRPIQATFLFALIVLVSDKYFAIPERVLSKPYVQRFFEMVQRLPIELQQHIAELWAGNSPLQRGYLDAALKIALEI